MHTTKIPSQTQTDRKKKLHAREPVPYFRSSGNRLWQIRRNGNSSTSYFLLPRRRAAVYQKLKIFYNVIESSLTTRRNWQTKTASQTEIFWWRQHNFSAIANLVIAHFAKMCKYGVRTLTLMRLFSAPSDLMMFVFLQNG